MGRKRGGTRPGIELGEKTESKGLGTSWNRIVTVTLGRKLPRKFRVGVGQGRSVRIAFRGNQRGFEWHGYVSTERGGRVFGDKVQGSTGAAGLLEMAGVYSPPCELCDGVEDVRYSYAYESGYYGHRKYLCPACRRSELEKRQKWLEERIADERAKKAIWLADRYVPCPKCGKFLVEIPSGKGAKTQPCTLCDEAADDEATRNEIHRKLWLAATGDRDRWSVAWGELARVTIEDKVGKRKILARDFEVFETLAYFMPPLPQHGTPERVEAVWNALREVALEEVTVWCRT